MEREEWRELFKRTGLAYGIMLGTENRKKQEGEYFEALHWEQTEHVSTALDQLIEADTAKVEAGGEAKPYFPRIMAIKAKIRGVKKKEGRQTGFEGTADWCALCENHGTVSLHHHESGWVTNCVRLTNPKEDIRVCGTAFACVCPLGAVWVERHHIERYHPGMLSTAITERSTAIDVSDTKELVRAYQAVLAGD